MQRLNVSTGAKWENIIGYSRAVKIGNVVEVSGTVATDSSGDVVGDNDMYLQTKFILLKIEGVLNQAGAKLSDVIRTRMYMTDISKWEEAGRAHGEVFGNIKPATAMLEVSKLIAPEYLIEIEVSAIIDDSETTI
jgi:enamine deaminase RidA (YjgF/YER057c/UK114 family)